MNIIFISMMKDLNGSGFSTQIMTDNIIKGWVDGGHKVHFAAIVDRDGRSESIRTDFESRVDKLTMIKSKTNTTVHTNKYSQFFFTILTFLNTWIYRKVVKEFEVDENTILVSHTPSLESAFVCKEIKRKHPSLTYIQYWSDPYCLSGKLTFEPSLKSRLQKMVETGILNWADEIVYGTPILARMQGELFPQFAERIRWVNVSYKPKTPKCKSPTNLLHRPLIGYIGDFDSYVRNIEPLYQVFMQEYCADFVICGRGSQKLESQGNLKVFGRMSPNEVASIEETLDVHVCLLNHSGFQIPGKIFYHTDTDKIILIVLDGNCKDEIRKYLEGFGRFIFCENDEESIRSVIRDICCGKAKVDLNRVGILSPANVSAEIIHIKGS